MKTKAAEEYWLFNGKDVYRITKKGTKLMTDRLFLPYYLKIVDTRKTKL